MVNDVPIVRQLVVGEEYQLNKCMPGHMFVYLDWAMINALNHTTLNGTHQALIRQFQRHLFDQLER